MSWLATVTQITYQDAMLNNECLKIYLLKSAQGILTSRVMLTACNVYFLVNSENCQMEMQDCYSFGSFGI
jgi:hypothetical protein